MHSILTADPEYHAVALRASLNVNEPSTRLFAAPQAGLKRVRLTVPDRGPARFPDSASEFF